jgi:hypothetical protein
MRLRSELKTLPVLAFAVAVLVVAIALMAVDTQKVRARSTCPSGTQKFAHVCIETTARAADTFTNASSTCASAQRRLPTSAELDAFRQQSGVSIGEGVNPEWTSNFLSPTSLLVLYDDGDRTEHSVSSSDMFRCVK